MNSVHNIICSVFLITVLCSAAGSFCCDAGSLDPFGSITAFSDAGYAENPEYYIPSHFTPLLYAAYYNDKKALLALLAQGANVNQQNKAGETPLHWAIFMGHEDVIKILIEHGANVNLPSNKGITPLHLPRAYVRTSTVGYELGIAQMLVAAGADVNQQDKVGRTPLVMAAIFGYEKDAQFLVDHGANVDLQDNNGMTPLHHTAYWRCAAYEEREITHILIAAHADSDLKDLDGQTPLLVATKTNNKKAALSLIEHGTNVNEPDNEGMTPLHWAAKHGEQKVTEFLLAHDASVNTQTKKGETPLHFAAWNDRQVIAQMLIAAGAAVDTQDMYGQTPLYGAAGKGHTEILQILIEHGAPVNQPKLIGYTPLYGAAFCGKPETVQMLIAAGAKFNGHDNQDKQTPLQIASQQGHKPIVDLLSHYIGLAQTIAMCTHQRLGATSPMALLSQNFVPPKNLIKDITRLVVQSEAYDVCHPQKQCVIL